MSDNYTHRKRRKLHRAYQAAEAVGQLQRSVLLWARACDLAEDAIKAAWAKEKPIFVPTRVRADFRFWPQSQTWGDGLYKNKSWLFWHCVWQDEAAFRTQRRQAIYEDLKREEG
ncbi:hypothetical protein LCGC14_2381720 [marine sediment metagenome]|uniref:Uncharacterized protein n=1 Tax=marine sediment metagenome TaxID=412755 RepID=A0A0F9ED67_9ZZZZ